MESSVETFKRLVGNTWERYDNLQNNFNSKLGSTIVPPKTSEKNEIFKYNAKLLKHPR